MSNLAAMLARIRAASPATASTALEAIATGQPLTAGYERVFPSLVPLPPEPETYTPVEPLPLIPIALNPRLPQADDLTLDRVQANPCLLMSASDRDAYDSGDMSEDLEAATARLFAAQQRILDSLGERVALAMGGETDLRTEPAATWCPACHPSKTLWEAHLATQAAGDTIQPTLAYTLDADTLRARCARGCVADAIAYAVAELVYRNEHHEHAMAQNKAVATAAASVRLSAVLGLDCEQRWVIPGLLPEDGLTLLSGTSGDGKTFTAMHLGLCIATGTKWFSYPAAQHRTLLLLLEGGKADHRRRLAALASGLDIPLSLLDGHLDIYPTPEFRADDPESVANLIALIKTLGHRAVIIDNLTAARDITDENSTANVTAAMKPLADLAVRHHLAVLLLHHANKQGELRGSSAIRQHADIVFELRRASAKNNARIIMTRTKDRYGQSLDELRYRFLDSVDDDGRLHAIIPSQLDPARPDPLDITPVVPELTLEQRVAAKNKPIDVSLTPRNRARMADILGALPASSKGIYDALKSSPNRVKALRDQLERDGKVVCRDGVWYKV